VIVTSLQRYHANKILLTQQNKLTWQQLKQLSLSWLVISVSRLRFILPLLTETVSVSVSLERKTDAEVGELLGLILVSLWIKTAEQRIII